MTVMTRIRTTTLRGALSALSLLAALSLVSCREMTSPSELMGSWRLQRMRLPGGRDVITIPDPSRFTVEFAADDRLLVRADCNGCGGSYTLEDRNDLAVSQLACTLIACPGAPLDSQFLGILTDAMTAEVDGGELEIRSKQGGELVFKR